LVIYAACAGKYKTKKAAWELRGRGAGRCDVTSKSVYMFPNALSLAEATICNCSKLQASVSHCTRILSWFCIRTSPFCIYILITWSQCIQSHVLLLKQHGLRFAGYG
jgi:hypothetical protein